MGWPLWRRWPPCCSAPAGQRNDLASAIARRIYTFICAMTNQASPKPDVRSELTDADRALWASFGRSIRPLPGRARPELPPGTEPSAAPAATASGRRPAPAARARAAAIAVGVHPPGVDSSTWSRFRTGKLAAARTLDLHGHTAQRAFNTLVVFLRTAHADRVRCVEVVTGRGNGETGGVIRREFPLWLNLPEIAPLVLAAAHPHAANPGSVRLLLRRVR
jgi:DNA-nicking Smr family endonuclease